MCCRACPVHFVVFGSVILFSTKFFNFFTRFSLSHIVLPPSSIHTAPQTPQTARNSIRNMAAPEPLWEHGDWAFRHYTFAIFSAFFFFLLLYSGFLFSRVCMHATCFAHPLTPYSLHHSRSMLFIFRVNVILIIETKFLLQRCGASVARARAASTASAPLGRPCSHSCFFSLCPPPPGLFATSALSSSPTLPT